MPPEEVLVPARWAARGDAGLPAPHSALAQHLLVPPPQPTPRCRGRRPWAQGCAPAVGVEPVPFCSVGLHASLFLFHCLWTAPFDYAPSVCCSAQDVTMRRFGKAGRIIIIFLFLLPYLRAMRAERSSSSVWVLLWWKVRACKPKLRGPGAWGAGSPPASGRQPRSCSGSPSSPRKLFPLWI